MRIDKYLAEKYGSRNKASEIIKKGLVLVDGKPVSASFDYREGQVLTFLEREEEFVSNGGYKLSKALRDFDFSVRGKIIADIGASNGGFTDCLFKNGALKVYCIDVGESLLDESLKGKNVVIIDGFNARNLNSNLFAEKIDGAVIDVSFISLTYILDAVANVLDDGAFVIALIKPQFECGNRNIGKNGIVRDMRQHRRIIEKIYDYAVQCNLQPVKLTDAPIRKNKNIEYLVLLIKGNIPKIPINELIEYVTL